MPAWLVELIAAIGEAAIIEALVNAGILPAWVTGEQNNVAVEESPYSIDSRTREMRAALLVGPVGLQAAKVHRDQIQADIAAARVSILEAIAGISNTEQPPWYTPPPSTGDTAADVWNYVYGDAEATGEMLMRLERMGFNFTYNAALPWNLDPNFAVVGPWKPVPED